MTKYTLLLELSTDELIRSTSTAFGNNRSQRSGLSVNNQKFSMVSKNNAHGLLCDATIHNSENASTYNVKVLFNNVEIADPESENQQNIINVDGQTKVAQISSNSDVQCTCECMDYKFRFADVNNMNRSLLGTPPAPYVRKTDTRPPVNPSSAPGMCKHLHKIIDNLKIDKIIQ